MGGGGGGVVAFLIEGWVGSGRVGFIDISFSSSLVVICLPLERARYRRRR